MTAADSHQSVTATKILIVEDEPDQLTLRTILLERQGFACVMAPDICAAKDALVAEVPDCVLMDLRIPAESDGLHFIHWLESLPRPPAIVILTGTRIARLRTRPALKKVAAFVEKGAPTCDLIATLKRVCGDCQSRGQKS